MVILIFSIGRSHESSLCLLVSPLVPQDPSQIKPEQSLCAGRSLTGSRGVFPLSDVTQEEHILQHMEICAFTVDEMKRNPTMVVYS